MIKITYLKNLFTRILLSIILILTISIYTSISDSNKTYFKNEIFSNTLAFTKINNYLTNKFGMLIPSINTSTVSSTNTLYENIELINNSYKVKLISNPVSFLYSGIVVFIGEKDDLGKTVIVQGIDGVDIWYSNLDNYNVKMYDYVEKDTILGEVTNLELILTFKENGNYISYENYLE